MLMVSIRNLTKAFGKTIAVDRLNLDIEKGEIFGLVGPDGAGKTTAIRLMLGIFRPDSGSGTVGSIDIVKRSESITTLTGYVSQRFSLYGELTVRENLELFADLYKVAPIDRASRLDRLMKFSRLDPFRDRLARNLSGGMKQKLALSCALIHTPQILFLDEPTTGVDPLSRRDLWRLLFDLWQEGVTIVVSTPYMDEAERCSRVGFISRGRMIAVGRPDELRARFTGSVFEVFAGDRFGAKRILERLPHVRDVNVFGEGLHVTVDSAVAASAVELVTAALSSKGIEVRSVRSVEPSIEDVFFQLAVKSLDETQHSLKDHGVVR
jgi:ABC-2 type transport system ATP-binding protein